MNTNNTDNNHSGIDHSNNKDMRNVAKYPDKRGLYIARPKNQFSVTHEAPVYHASNDDSAGTLFIAYPKDKMNATVGETSPNIPKIELQEGLFIAYPTHNKVGIAEKNVSRIKSQTSGDNYKSEKKKPIARFRVESIVDAPKTLLQRNAVVVSLLQLLRTKVS